MQFTHVPLFVIMKEGYLLCLYREISCFQKFTKCQILFNVNLHNKLNVYEYVI